MKTKTYKFEVAVTTPYNDSPVTEEEVHKYLFEGFDIGYYDIKVKEIKEE